MILSTKNWPIPGILGFMGGMLVFQLLFVNQSSIKTLSNDEDRQDFDYNNSTSLPEKIFNTVPSLQEDWGELECPLEGLTKDEKNLYDYITTVTLPCEKEVTVGGKFHGNGRKRTAFFDGEKYICLDRSFDFNNNNCIVLSFGIFTDWSFDDEMDKIYGCKVYAFDPTIGLKDHRHSKNVRFFNLGISDGPGFLKGGQLDSYNKILKKLNLENKTIDYLKMDVEGSEWKFFRNVLLETPNLLKNVRQIGMEIHLGSEQTAMVWNYFQHLHCLGFRILASHFNPAVKRFTVKGEVRSKVYEVVWGQDRNWYQIKERRELEKKLEYGRLQLHLRGK